EEGILVTANSDGMRLWKSGQDPNNIYWIKYTHVKKNKLGGIWLRQCSFNIDGTRIVVGCHFGDAYIVDCPSLNVLHTLKGHSKDVNGAVWHPSPNSNNNTHLVVTGSMDQSIKIWDASNGTCTKTIDNIGAFVCALSCSPNGSYIAV